jgi:hypothetical protein
MNIMLKSIKSKISTLAAVHKPTLRGVALSIGVGVGVSVVWILLMSYIETGSWYQSAEAVRKFEHWGGCTGSC